MGLSKLFFLKVIKLFVEKSLSESEIKLVLTDMVRFFDCSYFLSKSNVVGQLPLVLTSEREPKTMSGPLTPSTDTVCFS